LCTACSPGHSGHTDLPSPTPSSGLSPAVSYECLCFGKHSSNIRCGSRSLTHLSARLTVRADDGHAPPLGLSGKPFRLTINLPSALVRFPALNPIEPQCTPLVCSPANSLKFQPCGRSPQVARLTPTLRHGILPRSMPHQAGIVYGVDYRGI
jgi:hypothetical protein